MLKNHKNGFSFGEVLLSVLVLSVSLVGTVDLIARNIKDSIDSRDVTIASQLAQEGAEIVRNIRDDNWANNRISFDSATAGFSVSDDLTCAADLYSNVLNCNPGSYNLVVNGSNFYALSAATGQFRRRISINYDQSNNTTANTATVTSMVIWGAGGFPAIASCNLKAKCIYADLILAKWGE